MVHVVEVHAECASTMQQVIHWTHWLKNYGDMKRISLPSLLEYSLVNFCKCKPEVPSLGSEVRSALLLYLGIFPIETGAVIFPEESLLAAVFPCNSCTLASKFKVDLQSSFLLSSPTAMPIKVQACSVYLLHLLSWAEGNIPRALCHHLLYYPGPQKAILGTSERTDLDN